MIRTKGRYRNQTLELDQPLALAEGTEVEIDIHLAEEAPGAEHRGWAELGCSRLEKSGIILKTRCTTTGRSSMAFSAGDVVLVPFPYRDRLAERAWPAACSSPVPEHLRYSPPPAIRLDPHRQPATALCSGQSRRRRVVLCCLQQMHILAAHRATTRSPMSRCCVKKSLSATRATSPHPGRWIVTLTYAP